MKTSRIVKWRDGSVLAKDTPCRLEWRDQVAHICYLLAEGREYKVVPSRLPHYLDDIEVPTLEQLQEEVEEGQCSSVLGHTVEPDGWDHEGSPSWLLVFQVI